MQFDNLASGIGAYNYVLDPHGRFTFVSERLAGLWHRAAHEMIGRTFAELDYPLELAERFVGQVRQVVKTRQPVRDEVRFDTEIRKGIFEYIFVPLLGADQEVMAIAGITHNIEDRILAQKALLESEKQARDDVSALNLLQTFSTRLCETIELREVLALTLEGGIAISGSQRGTLQIIDADGCLKIEEHRGLDSEFIEFFRTVRKESRSTPCGFAAMQGEHTIVEDVLTDDLFKNTPGLQVMIASGVRAAISVPLTARAGRLVGMLNVHFSEPHRPDERVLQRLNVLVRQAAAFIERTYAQEELHHTAEQLAQSDRRKDEFLATLSHELRNPLAPLRNGLEILRRVGDHGEGSAQVLGMMDRQLGQMNRLVDDLLDMSRIGNEKILLRKERVPLASILEQAVETSRPMIERAGHELTFGLLPQPVFLDADPARITQVLVNLLNNAAKFTPSGSGRIQMLVELQKDEVIIRVQDNGVGIPGYALRSIFTMFSQLDNSVERTRSGLGIGLALAHGLVLMHGGTIEARSDGVGKGSEFVVRLPCFA